MKEEKNDVDMNVQCYLMHVGKDSWKEKVPTIVKQGALRFLVCPNSINQSVRGGRVGNLKCSAPGPVQECIMSMICITEWSPLLHSLNNDL